MKQRSVQLTHRRQLRTRLAAPYGIVSSGVNVALQVQGLNIFNQNGGVQGGGFIQQCLPQAPQLLQQQQMQPNPYQQQQMQPNPYQQQAANCQMVAAVLPQTQGTVSNLFVQQTGQGSTFSSVEDQDRRNRKEYRYCLYKYSKNSPATKRICVEVPKNKEIVGHIHALYDMSKIYNKLPGPRSTIEVPGFKFRGTSVKRVQLIQAMFEAAYGKRPTGAAGMMRSLMQEKITDRDGHQSLGKIPLQLLGYSLYIKSAGATFSVSDRLFLALGYLARSGNVSNISSIISRSPVQGGLPPLMPCLFSEVLDEKSLMSRDFFAKYAMDASLRTGSDKLKLLHGMHHISHNLSKPRDVSAEYKTFREQYNAAGKWDGGVHPNLTAIDYLYRCNPSLVPALEGKITTGVLLNSSILITCPAIVPIDKSAIVYLQGRGPRHTSSGWYTQFIGKCEGVMKSTSRINHAKKTGRSAMSYYSRRIEEIARSMSLPAMTSDSLMEPLAFVQQLFKLSSTVHDMEARIEDSVNAKLFARDAHPALRVAQTLRLPCGPVYSIAEYQLSGYSPPTRAPRSSSVVEFEKGGKGFKTLELKNDQATGKYWLRVLRREKGADGSYYEKPSSRVLAWFDRNYGVSRDNWRVFLRDCGDKAAPRPNFE